MSKSQRLQARSRRAPRLKGSREGARDARLDGYGKVEEPGRRLARGIFRRFDLDQRTAAKGLLLAGCVTGGQARSPPRHL